MAPSIIHDNIVQGETYLPGKIFMFSGFTLRANSLGQLEQIESYAPGHQVRFGSLNYVADIRGELVLDGFETVAVAAPCHHDEHDLNLSSNHTQEMEPTTAPALDSEQIMPSEDGKLNPTTEAMDPAALEPHTDLNSWDICITGTPDSSPVVNSEPRASQIQLRGHLPALTFRRCAKLIKNPLLSRGFKAELYPI